VSLFLTQPGMLDPNLALGLYVKAGNSEWLYRWVGCFTGNATWCIPRHSTTSWLHPPDQWITRDWVSCISYTIRQFFIGTVGRLLPGYTR
jgi:hypothetical protein